MDFRTLDVRTADGHALKLGACTGDCTGPSVLIMPGLYSHMGWYRPLAEALAARGAAAFLLDRRGTGISEGLPGHMDSWRHVVDDILRVVARIKDLHPAAAVCALGVSLGAAMTLSASLVERGSFLRQAALSPGLAPGLRIPLQRRLGLAYSGLVRPRVLYELPFTMEQLSDREEVRRALWEDPLRTRAVTSRFLLEVFLMQRFLRRNIARLQAPLLALVAAEDRMVDNQAVLQILKRSGRNPVRVVIFEGAHHVLPASVPLEELAERIWRWFVAPAGTLESRLVVERVAAGSGSTPAEVRP